MEFRVLGPLEVVAESDRTLPLGGGRQRALLAVLLVRRDEPVPVDAIVEELWGGRPPASAGKIVQGYVSQLRRVLGDALETAPPGYRLRVAPEALDAERAWRALSSTAEIPARDRAEALRAALGLWRGTALAEFSGVPSLELEAARLEELRLRLLKRRLDADLELGRHDEAVPELEQLVALHPLDEGLRAQLMLALYRSGRQADALDVYRQARRQLSSELGLELDEELRLLEQRILAHDPLLRPAVARTRPEQPWTRTEHASRRRLLIGTAAVAAAAVIATMVVVDDPESAADVAVAPNSVAVVDAERGSVVASIGVGRRPDQVVAGTDVVWVANVADRTVSRIDPERLSVTTTVGLGFEPTGLAADGDRVWVAGGYDHVLWRVDPDGIARLRISFAERLEPLAGGSEEGPTGVASAGGRVWLAHGDEVTEIDPETGEARRTIHAGGRWQPQIAATESHVWVGFNDRAARGTGTRPQPGLDTIRTAGPASRMRERLVSDASEILATAGRLWVALRFDSSVWELDPASGVVQRAHPAGNVPEGLAFLDETLWVTNERDGTLRAIDLGRVRHDA